MKLLEMMLLVDKSEDNKASAAYEGFCNFFNIECDWQQYDAFENRVQAFYLRKWYCTDTWVGTVVYLLDNEVVAVSNQEGRKCPMVFEFVNKPSAIKLKTFLLSLVPEEEVAVINPDKEVAEFYTVYYCNQLLSKEGLVDGQPCVIVAEDPDYLGKEVTVEFNNKTTKKVPLTEFKIPYHFKR